MTRRMMGIGLVALAAGLGGCSGEPPVGMVAGQVTLEGKPVAGGIVTFLSPTGGTPVTANIGEDGKYRAVNVPAGDMMVGVLPPPEEGAAPGEIIKKRGADPKAAAAPPPPPKQKVQFPAKYADPSTSGFTVKVRPEKEGEVAFDIPMKK